ncbi:MAG: nucleotidyltransferase [Chloroflexi bacterium]|nr:nucleotidyltransferase [Chloroflexota bacterium]
MLVNPEALRVVVDFLNQHRIPHMVIGGLANAVWGEVRMTRDADFKVSTEMLPSDFRRLVLGRFPERQTGLPPHLRSSFVIHIWAMPDVAVDLLMSVFDYERQAIARAVDATIEGIPARVCTAEDLIIHKAIANRTQDWMDIEGVLLRQGNKLNLVYLRDWLAQFAEALENPELLTRFNDLYDRVRE